MFTARRPFIRALFRMSSAAPTWAALESAAPPAPVDRSRGPPSAQALIRVFDADEAAADRVTLYRDHHAWCPYCQKVWFFLEERRIPYKIAKVTMRCYGPKEKWFTDIVPSGMLPALALDGQLITESDDILEALEAAFGPLPGTPGLNDARVRPLRALERRLFRAWCTWLCYPSRVPADEGARREAFAAVARDVEAALRSTRGPYFLEEFSVADVVFVPYVERMRASLFYYKGYDLVAQHPALGAWFEALEARPAYAPLASDFSTHAHDLPPQMGGCYSSGDAAARAAARAVDDGPGDALPETSVPRPPGGAASAEALGRVLRHRAALARVNPFAQGAAAAAAFDEGLRAALGVLAAEAAGAAAGGTPLVRAPPAAAKALRYVRQRVNVPRDMSIHAARALKAAIDAVADAADVPPVNAANRFDQDPRPFLV
jgi:glutathione S-transferase